jgi:hypothetical protein
MQTRIGYFEVERRLKAAGLRVEPLINGAMLVLPENAMFTVIPRGEGRLPEYDPAAIELVINTMRVFAGANAEYELTPEQMDLFCRAVSRGRPEGKG